MTYKLPHATTTEHGVMQVGTNLTVTDGVVSSVGGSGIVTDSYYGKFFSDVTQTNPVVDTANPVTFNGATYTKGITNGAGSEITIVNAGIYAITYDLQGEITSGGGGDIDVWARINGVDVPGTNSVSLLDGGGARRLVSRTFLLDFADGDVFELIWSSPLLDMQLTAIGPQIDPIRPTTNSANILITLVEATI